MIPRLDEFPIAERAPAELEVLSSGHEDVYGLWDIAAGVNSELPGRAVAHVLRLTQAVVFDLLERGLFELSFGHGLENEGASQIVAAQHREAALADPASWDPYAHARTEADPYYTVTGTPEGIQEYYRLEWAAAEGREPQPPSPPLHEPDGASRAHRASSADRADRARATPVIPRLDEFPIAERAPAELEVLSSGHESVYGLWEIAAGVNGELPGRAVAHLLRLTQAVVFDLVERGLLELSYGHELENGGASQVVAAEHREAALADPASWDGYARTEADPYYTVIGTPAGVQEYYRLGWAAAEGREPQPPSPPLHEPDGAS